MRTEKFCTFSSAVAVENCVIGAAEHLTDLQIVNTAVRIFLILPASLLTHNPSIKPLNMKLQRSNPQPTPRPQIKLLLQQQLLIQPKTSIQIMIQISQHQFPFNRK